MIISYLFIRIISERRDNIEVKIIGSDTPEGTKVKNELKKIAKKQRLDISILEINDEKNIRKYKVLQTPTLIINDEYKCNYEKFDYSLLKRLVMFYS